MPRLGTTLAEMPTGTVTFLFTDLEGSTRLWQDHPVVMQRALSRHDELVRGAIESHDGLVVKTTGDGFHAAFAAAHDAIGAAVAAQLALAGEPWGETGTLRVRMGVHSGTAELRDRDYYGTAVNKAARLTSVAHGGQIVVSRATEELVSGSQVELVDLGEHSLRDLVRPERVFQVVHPGLAREFPRLLSLKSSSGNLPAQVTSFVGRDDDVARVVASLHDASLVTLTGTGGVGKTRLALQSAAEVAPRFPDGAWLCELATVDDGEAMAQVVAATLGCVQRAGLSLTESVVEYVKLREMLIVFDNCEHLLDEVSELAGSVVRSCPKVRVMATSREPLDVAGERVVRVRSLPSPEPSVRGEESLASASVRLFADRAVDAGVETTWDDQQWAAVGEICRRVDGIPLAIELAAARAAAMSPTDVAAHLDERFRLLTGRRRGRVERHQTLRATVDWSYQLLDNVERVVFDRLGVFVGTFDASAATAVVGGDEHDLWEITDALANLAAKSMLVTETGSDGTTRYTMLETLRQFARERLEETDDSDRWRRAFAEHYACSVVDIGRGLVGRDHRLWIAKLRAELDNIRAAIVWALERDDLDEQRLALRILASLGEPIRMRPDLALGAVVVQALAAATTMTPELRVPVMTGAAYHEWNQGQSARALELVHDALRNGIVITDVNPMGPYILAVTFEMAAGNHTRALQIAEDARAELGRIENAYAQATMLSSIAAFEAMSGRLDQARADAERALELARGTGNAVAIAASLTGIAWAFQRDDPAAALAAAEEHIGIYRQFDVGYGATSSVFSLAGGLRARLGDDAGALEFLHEAITIARDHGVKPQLAAALDWTLSPLLRTGRPDLAAVFLGALLHGALATVTDFPGVSAARSRALERARAALGDEAETELARGAAMNNDELIEYALARLDPGA